MPTLTYALQETNADIKTMHVAKTELNKRQIRTIWSTPVEINKCGSGTTVAAAAPLYCTQLINNTLEAEMEELVGSSRIAASWIQTNGVERGIAVISFYGISGSNSDANKRRANERHLKTMWRYLAHHRKKPIFICMDANVHTEKSEVLQAMKAAGWSDVANGLGDTFRMSFHKKREDDKILWNKLGEQHFGLHHAKTGNAIQEDQITELGPEWNTNKLIDAGYADLEKGKEITNGKIDYILVNEKARIMVRDVKVHFIDNFQHAAIDVKIDMTIHKGPSETLVTPKKIPECDPLRGNDAYEYKYWTEETRQHEFEAEHSQA